MLIYGMRKEQLGWGGQVEIWRCGIYICCRSNQLDTIYEEPLCARQQFAVCDLF
jgi:hypothetical protein